ncbi:MAG: aminopeptidase P family protein [Acidimicrobiia bacterium]|nr:aminopeptidase P family protein [Acidimicrobiia bacterium]
MKPAMDVAGRAEQVRSELANNQCDALLVTNLVNVRYLSGFTGTAGLLWLGPDEVLLITDRRYESQVEAEISDAGANVRVEITNDSPKAILTKMLAKVTRVGLEAASVSWANQRRYAEWLDGSELVPTDGLIEGCRQVKDEGEIARMVAAASIADAALAEVLPMLVEVPTEQQVALALDAAVRRLGAQDSAFTTIVASGPNAALPHLRPTRRKIGKGELVIIDMGAVVEGYRSDMSRTVSVGEPKAEALKVFETVQEAQRLGVEKVAPGRPIADVDKVCRDRIAEEGWAEAFVHSTGHGVGLDIHEQPWVRAKATEQLRVGHVITVEPGVYLPGSCGARVEDTLVVASEGSRTLTRSPKDLVVA